ncbi:MAG: hypothetical protein JO323_06635 [Acidobacteriia bacterium]|nr:hypothetical protein [Terriglobia bacterium]
MYNPFQSHAAGVDLDRDRADASEIHSEAFGRCREMIVRVRQHRETQALLILGEAGAGKTHLLGRLERWLERSSEQGEASVFVPIRLASGGRMLWRLIRERLAQALLKRIDDGRRLLQIVLPAPAAASEIPYDLGVVLKNLFEGVRVRESAAWLQGYDLPQPALDLLALAPPRDDESLEAASERVVINLCNLIAPVPVVFCLDQLESIQTHPGDSTGFPQFGSVISALHDGAAKNVAIISCLKTGLLVGFVEHVGQFAADRIAKRQVALHPLNFEQACRLAAARLDSVPELRALRAQQAEPVWPLDRRALKAGFPKDGLLVARAVIFRCFELFERWQGHAAEPEISTDEFLHRTFEERIQATPVEQSEAILRNGLPALFRLRGLSYAPPEAASILEGTLQTERPTAIAISNHDARGTGLSRRLERLASEWPAATPALTVFRDARRGIGPGARRTLERLKTLENRGAKLINVKPEALAALNALNQLLADARSEDLAMRGDPVPLATVEQWLANHLSPSLEDLLEHIGQAPSSDFTAQLVDLVNKTKIIRLDEAAGTLQRPVEEVEALARSYPALFGFAGGSARVLFRAVPPVPSG